MCFDIRIGVPTLRAPGKAEAKVEILPLDAEVEIETEADVEGTSGDAGGKVEPAAAEATVLSLSIGLETGAAIILFARKYSIEVTEDDDVGQGERE